MAAASFEDFYEVPDLNFDISKLKDDLDKILKLKKLDQKLKTILYSQKNVMLL